MKRKRLFEFNFFNHRIVIWAEKKGGVIVRTNRNLLKDLIAFLLGGRTKNLGGYNYYSFPDRETVNHFCFLMKMPARKDLT